ncbi:MATE family efflux transporter [Actinoplanes sp. LDG1-06]|uniref:Probable multidrug resistance protein NorM n=1 Tax=Paractinoplanes ovalisporus TaxID=2810368 RepID=A0ABS2A4L5_9ACTN|nr:MATE family efflux transporter [Actinoplanes ovalisporus]MBM2614787.1 MATE family efflux transporter [Actinoplanes ovalisporus]
MVTERARPDAAEASAPVRAVLGLGLPILVGSLSAVLAGLVDTAMIGHYGSAELTAVAASSAVFDIFVNILMASLIAHQIVAARSAGAGNPGGIRRSLRASLAYSGAIALLLAVLTWAAGGWLAGLIGGDDPGLRDLASGYLSARAPSLLLLVPFGLLIATFGAYKRPRYAMIAGLGVNAVNLGLDALLIYGPGPFPEMGAVGNGLSTTVATAAGLVFLIVAAARFEPFREIRRAEPAEAGFETSVHKLSWPAMVSTAADYGALALFFVVVGLAGTAALAGGRIGAELHVLVFAALTAFAAATRILTGRAVGAGDLEAARRHWRAGRRTILAGVVPLAVLFLAAPNALASVFTSSRETVDAAGSAIVVVAFTLPLMAWCLGSTSLLKALGRTGWDMWANLAAAWLVQLPVAWVLAVPLDLGLEGAFAGLVAYWLARAVASEVLARRAFHKLTQPEEQS